MPVRVPRRAGRFVEALESRRLLTVVTPLTLASCPACVFSVALRTLPVSVTTLCFTSTSMSRAARLLFLILAAICD